MGRLSAQTAWFGFLFAGLFVLPGCGSAGPKLIPVSGKIIVGGAPLKSGTINLVADDSKGTTQKGTSAGSIGPDGTYKITTDGVDGAPPGWYKVMIITKFPGAPEDAVTLNPKYTDPKTAPSFEVTADAKPGAYDLLLTK